MAKRKNSAALFEVIHSDKRLKSSAKSWSMPSLPSLPSPIAWLRKRADKAPTAGTSSTAPTPSRVSRLWSFLPSMTRVKMSMDSDHQIVSFRVSYTAALVSGFAVVAAISLAFVIGKQLHHRGAPALADQTTEELRAGPARPDVLDVNNSAPMAMASTEVPREIDSPAAHPVKSAPPQTARPTFSEPKPPTTSSELNGHRTVNQQYVLIQSYPAAEKSLADDACKMLCSRGILCTVEYNLDFAPRWYSVVGVTGFDRVKNVPEYEEYVAEIQKVSDSFAGKSKFKSFRPTPIRWREPKPQ